MTGFNGVSTKYLPNYLVWFKQYDALGDAPPKAIADLLLRDSHSTVSFAQIGNLIA